jgi:hypothetical protein
LAPTSPSAPLPRDKSLGESAYLQEQAANAKAAIKNTLSDLGEQLGKAADPRLLTQSHPWAAVGTAAIAGFIAAAAFVPSREDRALKRLAKIEQALSGHNGNGKETVKTTQAGGKTKVEKKGMLSTVLGELVKSMGPALASSLTAAVSIDSNMKRSGQSAPPPPSSPGTT